MFDKLLRFFFLRAERKGREVVISIVFPSFDWLTSALDPKNGGQFQGHVWEHNKAVVTLLYFESLCAICLQKQCLLALVFGYY